MTDIYINRRGITYEAKVSIHSVGQDDTVWVAEIDDELFYVELVSSASIVDVIKAVQDEFNAARDQDELDVYKTEANALGKAAGLEGDVFDMIVQWYEEVTKDNQNLHEAFSKVEVVETEARQYHTDLVSDFIEALGFEDEKIHSINVAHGSIEVTYWATADKPYGTHLHTETFPIGEIAGE